MTTRYDGAPHAAHLAQGRCPTPRSLLPPQINLHKRLHGVGFKRKAPRALNEIRKFARESMFTKDVRIDTNVNKEVWSKGIRNVPRRIRIRLSRKRNDDEEAEERLYTLVTVSPDTETRQETKTVDE